MTSETEKDLKLKLLNEFASIEIAADYSANGPRLRITDLVDGSTRYLDPILLECLTRMPAESFDDFVLRGSGLGSDVEL